MSLTDFNNLTTGNNIDIQRSDGRVHSAVIRSIDKSNLKVTVEWYENRETKGKEIDLGRIFELNPSIDFNEFIVKNSQSSQSSQQTNINIIVPKEDKEKQIGNDHPLPLLKPSEKNKHDSLLSVIKLTNVSLSMVNSSFGWIKGNGYKNPLRQSSCVRKDVEKIHINRGKSTKIYKNQIEIDSSNPNFDFLTMIKDYQRSLNYSPITNQDIVEKRQICVCVRKRPLNGIENSRKEIDVISIPNKQSVVVHEPKLKVDLTKYLENQQFRFDYAFDENVDNSIVYRFTAKPLVECLFERGMATCFAYGQTGSGKTHTMGGEFQCKGLQNCSNGIYALTARDVFRLLNTKYRIEELYVECAFFEIYAGKVFDLLNKKERLRILEDRRGKVQVVGLKCETVENVEEVLKIIQHGTLIRVSGQTSANLNSSRSHAVFQIILRKKVSKKLYGKFSLIDLAGNERGADTSSSNKVTRMEGAEINKSLLALKECIRALGKKGTHCPFRASKLTQVLRDSFIGDLSQTCMISTISPGLQSYEHTLNTLRYADRVKELGPRNMEVDDTILLSNTSTPVSGSGDEVFLKNFNHMDSYLPFMENKEENYSPIKLYLETSEKQSLQRKDKKSLESEKIEEDVDDDEDEKTLQNEDNKDELKKHVEFTCISDICKHFKNEEDIIRQHSNLTDRMPQWLQTHSELYKMTEYGELNVSDYTVRLGIILTEEINELIKLKDRIAVIRTKFGEK